MYTPFWTDKIAWRAVPLYVLACDGINVESVSFFDPHLFGFWSFLSGGNFNGRLVEHFNVFIDDRVIVRESQFRFAVSAQIIDEVVILLIFDASFLAC